MDSTSRAFPHSRTALLIAAAALALFATAQRAGAATQADVFNPYCVSSVDITAPQSSLDALAIDPKGEYQPATMVVNVCGNEELPVKNITFRLKGSGSFEPLTGKAAFKIKMSSPNRIDGLKSLTLNNMVQDASMIHEALAYKAFRAVGVAAPRAGYASVSITNSNTDVTTDYGLHANIESLDDRFLNATYGSGTWGHLYEGPDWTQFGANRDILPTHVPNFETEESASGALATDLADLANISTISNSEQWWTAFQQKLDVTKVMRFLATEFYLGHWDGYSTNINNYYLHSTLAGVFDFIPSGADGTFGAALSLDPTSAQGQLTNRCLQVAPCLAEFRSARNFIAETIIELDLVEEAHHLVWAIADAVKADTRKHQTVEQQCHAADDTISFLKGRESLWRTTYRVPNSGITSNQSSESIECGEDGPEDPWTPPAPEPTPPTGATGPSSEVKLDPPPSAPQCTFSCFSKKVTLKKFRKCIKSNGSLSLSPIYDTPSEVSEAMLFVGKQSAYAWKPPFNPKIKFKKRSRGKTYRYDFVLKFKEQNGIPIQRVERFGHFRTCK